MYIKLYSVLKKKIHEIRQYEFMNKFYRSIKNLGIKVIYKKSDNFP
jgi:hypothetical protein